MKKSRVLIPVIAVGLVGGGIYWRISQNDDAAEVVQGTPAEEPAAPALPVAVKGVGVIRDTLMMKVVADGHAVAARQVTLSARIEGPVRQIPVRENMYVQQGDLLVGIDPSALQYDLQNALHDSIVAWNQFHADTIGDGLNPNVEERRAHAARVMEQSGIPASRIRLEQLREQISRADVRAPFNGRVANLNVVLDQWVGSGTQLVSVMQLDPIHVVVEVTEAEIWQVQVGRSAEIEFSGIQDEVFRGRVIAINPQADDKRTVPVTIEVPNPDGRILPGFYASARLDGESYADVLLVPIASIIEPEFERSDYVFIFSGDSETGTARRQAVSLGRRNDIFVEIIDNPDSMQDRLLEPGEIVLIEGHELLNDGANVRLVSDAGGPPGGG